VNQNTGALYRDVATALREDRDPGAIVSVPAAFTAIPRRARPSAYRAMRASGKAARLLKGQRRRAGGH
jgi:hypothetical protein